MVASLRDRLLNYGSALFLAGAGVYAGLNLWRRMDAPPPPPPPGAVQAAGLAADSFKGRAADSILIRTPSVDSLWLSLRGSRATAIYVFRTTCQFCQSQRAQIGTLLSQLAGEPILTVASEPPEALSDYWPPGVEPPLTIHGSSARALGIKAVPSWVFVAPDGRIHDVVVGVTPRWTRDSIIDRLRLAQAEFESASSALGGHR